MNIAEIVNLLPRDEAELASATTWQEYSSQSRQHLFRARTELENLIRASKTLPIAIFDALDLLPADPPVFEQLLASAQGQTAVRGNIMKAIELLKNLEVKDV